MNESERYSVKFMSKELQVSRSGYYAWQKQLKGKLWGENMYLSEKIKTIFRKNWQVYGSPRITKELRDEGFNFGKNRVARLMKKHGITAKVKKRFRVTTNSNHRLPVAQNLVDMQFNPERPNSLWTTDITYIWTKEGWLYLAVVMDLWSRKIIGWKADNVMDVSLVTESLSKAIRSRKPDRGLIVHSDRGSQYASLKFRNMLKENNIKQSMSSKGNCYDNAPAESFFSTLKRELIYRVSYKTREETIRSLFEYIEVFYNRQRRHSTLGYLSPMQFENLNYNT